MSNLLERHSDKIRGVLSCFDRVVIQGTLPSLCYAEGMTKFLSRQNIRQFDYPRFAERYRDIIRANTERLAKGAGCEVVFVRKPSVRKEDLVAAAVKARGTHPGLVVVLSAVESCQTYRPWYDKHLGRACLKFDTAKCLHYYFYFIDRELGLCYVRVPTWCPFRLQVYFNGHAQLAAALDKCGIPYRMLDNAFVEVGDLEKAQRLADRIDVSKLHAKLDRYAKLYCPPAAMLGEQYRWSLMQVEYSTDIIFRKQDELAPIYEAIVRLAVQAVKADNVATFLSRRISAASRDEMGNDFSTRIHGTRLKHQMGPASIKMYDKRGIDLRIETTITDVTFFRHHRWVERNDGVRTFKLAPLKKSIYSLVDLRELMATANQRYIEFISALDDPRVDLKALKKVAERAEQNGRRYRGINFFLTEDMRLTNVLVRGEFAISGLRNKDLRRFLPDKKAGWISRCLKRLRMHGLLKSIGHRYKYYLTELGRRLLITATKLREMVVIPSLATAA